MGIHIAHLAGICFTLFPEGLVATDKQRERVLILGAAGRDFHTFNVRFRDDPNYRIVAFTAAQIPGIESRRYPPSLSGSHYPDGSRWYR
jgi:predicted GTPase